MHESHAYDVALLCEDELDGREVSWLLNDDDPVRLRLSNPFSVAGPDGKPCLLYQLLPRDEATGQGSCWKPFALLYGFARIALEVPNATGLGEALELSTRDVACVCDRSDQEIPVAQMVRELVDAPDGEVVAWMLGKVGGEAEHGSLVEACGVTDTSESLSSYLDLCERVLKGYERNLPYLCRHAYSRTVKTDLMLEPSQVRRAGRRELLWLAGNPDALQKTSVKTAIRMGGECYTATRLRTERPMLTYDNRENRAVLAFIDQVASSLNDIIAQAQEQAGRLRAMAERLRRLFDGDGLLPSLVVIEACLAREEPLVARAEGLRRRARKVSATLSRDLPQVERVRYRLPKRTKPFQEIPAYVELHALMRGWEAFGEFALERDGLLLHTWRMDKLYEYYLLYLLLSTLKGLGFQLDATGDAPVCMTHYSLRSLYYDAEEQVAGLYRLARGDEKLALYYQPVFFCDGTEEYGVDLHRTTAYSRSPYWTPDYLLVVDAPGAHRKRLVLDAKFRRFDDVRPDFSTQEERSKKSTLLECQRKYLLETAGPAGVRPDCVWLLCGRAKEKAIWTERLTEWSTDQGMLPCGVATAVPGANALVEMLAAVGLGDLGAAVAFVPAGDGFETAGVEPAASRKRDTRVSSQARQDHAQEAVDGCEKGRVTPR